MKIISLLGIGCCILFGLQSNAQTLVGLSDSGFVSMDLTTCSYKILNRGITSDNASDGISTFDARNQRYIWETHDNASHNDIIHLTDAATGKSLEDDTVPPLRMGEIEYDPVNNTIYGLGNYTFNAYNLSTHTLSTVATYDSVVSVTIGNTCFDTVTETYYFLKSNTKSNAFLMAVAAHTGKQTLINIPNMAMPEIDKSTGILYGIDDDGFVSFELSTKKYTVINGLVPMTYYMGMSTYDARHGTYIFSYSSMGNGDYVLEIDVATGNLSSCSIPQNYFYDLEYYDKADTTQSSINQALPRLLRIFPNPSSGENFSVATEGFATGLPLHVLVYNSSGILEESQTIANHNPSGMDISLGNHGPGLYQVIVHDGITYKSAKLERY